MCRDFDYILVEKTADVVLMEDASDCVINFSDFVYAFQLQFYYEEFCEVICSLLLTGGCQKGPKNRKTARNFGKARTKIKQKLNNRTKITKAANRRNVRNRKTTL